MNAAEHYYPLVTEAIRRAEVLEDLSAPGTSSAYLDLSLLEEKIAEILPAADPEGALARRGAVRAALAADEIGRVRQLVDRYVGDAGAGQDLRAELLEFIQKAESTSAARFPRAAEKYGLSAIRRLAEAFVQQEAPFPIG